MFRRCFGSEIFPGPLIHWLGHIFGCPSYFSLVSEKKMPSVLFILGKKQVAFVVSHISNSSTEILEIPFSGLTKETLRTFIH